MRQPLELEGSLFALGSKVTEARAFCIGGDCRDKRGGKHLKFPVLPNV